MSSSEIVALGDVTVSMTEAEDSFGFKIDKKTGVPTVVGGDKFNSVLEDVLSLAQNYEFTGEEDERKANKNALAQIRKVDKAFLARSKEFKNAYMAEFFSSFDEDVTKADTTMKEIIDLLNSRSKQADEDFKARRTQMLVDTFNGVAVLSDELDDLDASIFIVDKMLLHSTTDKKAIEMLNANVEQFEKAIALGVMAEWSNEEIANNLSSVDWSTLDCIAEYQEQQKRAAEAEALAKQAEIERQEREAHKASHTIVRLSVANSDLDKLRDFIKTIDCSEL